MKNTLENIKMEGMKDITKTISALKKELNEVNLELADSYKVLGNKLMLDAADPASEKSIPSKNELISWQRLRDERSFCTNSILEIKNNSARFAEIEKFKAQIKNGKNSSIKKIAEIKGSFLTKLYKDFFPNCPALFSSVTDKTHPVEAVIDEANTAIASLEQQKAEANFFSRLGLSGKITAQKSKIKNAEKSITSILEKNITDIQSSEEIKAVIQSENTDKNLKTEYEELTSLYNSLSDSDNRIKMLEEEGEFINSKLAELDAKKNPSKRINTITNRIKELDSVIDSVLQRTALNYTNAFYTEEGSFISDVKEENLGIYHEYLKRISANRKRAAQIKYNIEYCETLQDIKTEETRIENLNRIIKNSEAAIEEANRKITDSKTAILNAENKITDLTAAANELFKKFSNKDAAENCDEETC